MIRKHREIASDLEFSSTRHFVSKVYENVLKNYHKLTLNAISDVKIAHTSLNEKINNPYIKITNATISHFNKKIEDSKNYMKKIFY